MNKLEPSQWIKDPYMKHDKDLELIELFNTETNESLTVAKQDADRVLKLIQQRFTCITKDKEIQYWKHKIVSLLFILGRYTTTEKLQGLLKEIDNDGYELDNELFKGESDD